MPSKKKFAMAFAGSLLALFVTAPLAFADEAPSGSSNSGAQTGSGNGVLESILGNNLSNNNGNGGNSLSLINFTRP